MYKWTSGSIFIVAMLLSASSLIGEEAIRSPAPPREDLSPRISTVKVPEVVDGKLSRKFLENGYTVSLDLAPQVLDLFLPKQEDWRQKGEFSTGDLVRVKQSTALRRGTTTLASIGAGKQLTVHRIHDDGKWLETGVVSNGKLVRGWVQTTEVDLISAESPLLPSLKDVSGGEFASAGVLAHKAKQFDDGLMAAVQLAAQTGRGKFRGKVTLLQHLADQVANQESAKVVLAACVLGKIPVDIPPATRREVDTFVAEFLADATRSKPIAFYTWSPNLAAVFQQDRMLQTDLTTLPGVDALGMAKALRADQVGRKTYDGYLKLQSQLTNPLVAFDLRPVLKVLDEGESPEVAQGTSFFPPSYSHEIDLLKRLFPDGNIPPGFQVMEELVNRVKSGELELTPRPDSGWYDQQLWSLEPFLRPHQTPEGSRWKGNDEYYGHLTKLFKGVWALARETHIKDLEVPLTAAAAPFDRPKPKIKIRVEPQLSSEPLATSYLRRALGYRFVRHVLTEHFGEEALKELRRLTVSGPVSSNLDDELRQMEGLFYGAAVAVTRQLGLAEANEQNVGSGSGADSDAGAYLTWAANLHLDPDLATDIRMMVPLYYDLTLRKTKVWAFLGWTTQRVYVSFEKEPTVTVLDKAGNDVDPDRLEISYSGKSYTIATPVFQEVFVSKLLNRDEFRKHCDAYESTAAIVKNLE